MSMKGTTKIKPMKGDAENASQNIKNYKTSHKATTALDHDPKKKMKKAKNDPKKKMKKAKTTKQKLTVGPSESCFSNKTPSDKKRNLIKKKKKSFNKEAIEKMKARQLARKEKQMQQNSPAAPAKPEAKRRRPKLPVRLESVNLKFSEEDDSMTQFEGVWVPREETGRLQSARQQLEKRGLAAELVSRRMKRLVRREHRKLKLTLIAAQTKTERAARERRQFLESQQTRRVRRRVPGRSCGLTLLENEQLARFDGFWVSAEAVPRLEALRQKFADEGKSEDEARRLLRKARRVEERKVKSSGRLLCTKCGRRGHLMSDCVAQAVDPAAGMSCFRCGQAGHRLADCPQKGQIAGLPFATCFLCKQQGHMSRECPQAAGDAGQKPSRKRKTGEAEVVSGMGQSWRGLKHDADCTTEESAVKKTPRSSGSQQKARVHIRFD